MIENIQNVSVTSLHKLIVVKGNNFFPLKESYLLLIWDKVIDELKVLINYVEYELIPKKNYKEINYGLQILYKLSTFIYENKTEVTEEFLSKLAKSIHDLIIFSSNFTSIELLISISLIIVMTLKIKYGLQILEMTDKLINKTCLTTLNDELLNFFLEKFSNNDNFSFTLTLSLAMLNFQFCDLKVREFYCNLVNFINERTAKTYDEFILKSTFFRKVSDVISISNETEFTLKIAKTLIFHCMDQQFVKQNLIRTNTSEILQAMLKIHLKYCSGCCHTKFCSFLYGNIQAILAQSWNLSGKFIFLNIFIKVFGNAFCALEPKLSNTLLQSIQEYSLSTFAISTLISLVLNSHDSNVIESIVDLFDGQGSIIYTDVNKIRNSICECLVPKLSQESSEKVWEIIIVASSRPKGVCQNLKKLILFSVHNLLYSNNKKKIEKMEKESVLNLIWNDTFCSEASTDCDESVRMQLFSILCKEIVRYNKQDHFAWKQIYQLLIKNLSSSSNKLVQHIITNFKTVLNIVVVKNLEFAELESTKFISQFLKYLVSQLLPGISFFKRSTILAYLELLFSNLEGKILLDILKMTEDDYMVLLKVLVYFFTDTFEENRINALKCFVILIGQNLKFNQFDTLKRIAFEKSTTSNPHDCCVAYTIMKTLFNVKDPLLLSPKDVIAMLLSRMETDLNHCKEDADLVRIAMQSPFYSPLFCLRKLINEYIDEFMEIDIIERIISICFRVNQTIYPFISSAAPEGCLPEDFSSLTEFSNLEYHAEYLMICCWRSCKELSLILGHLSATLVNRNLEYFPKIKTISDFFYSQLTTVTHKGAFESLSAGFEKLCLSLWRSVHSNFTSIPQHLIQKSIDILCNNKHLCATRRSAGLPHLFHVLITTEPLLNKERSSLKLVLEHFRSILSTADSSNSLDRKTIIHIFNILRVLFKESTLQTQMVSYTFLGIKYSVKFFTCNEWPLRNSATLLYCSLMERIFGPSKTVKFHHKFNRLNSKLFFNRYPNTYEFICDYLTECSESPLNLETSTKVYPILIILARLVPESDNFHNTPYDLSVIREQIVRYLSSPVWIIRVSAAKAISALSQGELNSFNIIDNLLEKIILYGNSHNFIHGLIKTIRCALEDLLDNSFISSEQKELLQHKIEFIWEKLSPVVLQFTNGSHCQIELIGFLEFIMKKSSTFLNKISMEKFKCGNLNTFWHVKLFVIAISLETCDVCHKDTIIKLFQNPDHLIRSEILSQLCRNPVLIDRHFEDIDFVDLFNLMINERHPGVDIFWLKFTDLFLRSTNRQKCSLRRNSLLNFLFEKLNNHQRTKTFCSIIELLGTIFEIDFETEDKKDFNRYVDLIKGNCFYEIDMEIRTSCAKSLGQALKNYSNISHKTFGKLVEIVIVQLNDEEIDIRNLAGKCLEKLLRVDNIDQSISKWIQTKFVDDLILNRNYDRSICLMTDLKMNSPLGFDNNSIIINQKEKNSVFDSEEINFYYDFMDIHAGLELNFDASKQLILQYPIEQIINNSKEFVKKYQMTLLDK